MKKNLILSAAIGYKFEQIEFFIKSLRKYYKDNVTFLIGEKDFGLEEELKKFNCSVIKTNINKETISIIHYMNKKFIHIINNYYKCTTYIVDYKFTTYRKGRH